MANLNGHVANGTVNGVLDDRLGKHESARKGMIDIVSSGKRCIWNKKVKGTQMEKFRNLVNEKYNLKLKNYWDLHKWSVEHYEDFWKEVFHFVGLIYSKPYEKIFNPAECFADIEWFPGLRMNYAENMLKHRDDSTAVIQLNERNEEKRYTFKQMYEEVQAYAAAFRKNGLKKGDRVAFYMSNRSETVFAVLAIASIGGMCGGPLPFYGARAASNIIKMVKPKFIIAVDKFVDENKQYDLLKNLPEMANGMDSVEKVIVVPSSQQSLSADISGIKNSCFLADFLETGRDEDGNFPELVFEQLPFNHPLFFGFTSGTTGLPKGMIHSAGTLLALLREFFIHLSFGRGDVILATLPIGWNLWNIYISNLALGATMLLYEGCPFYISKTYIWDLFAKYKVTNTFIVTSFVDRMEKEDIVPAPDCNLDRLKILTIGGSPVKLRNFEFMKRILPESVFIASYYGSTEFFGTLGCVDYNEPVYSGEIQVPTLGTDIRCFDETGRHVWGKRGELVIATPTPAMAMDFFVDTEGIKRVYFSPYPGVWTQHDEVWFDPETKGFVVIGRSDETMNPSGERFCSSEIYNAIHSIKELADYVCVGQFNKEGDERAVLFVRLNKGYSFTPELVQRIKKTIETEMFIDCVPEVVLEVKDIPYNLNRKKMESLVRTIINRNEIPAEVPNIRNPESMKFYVDIPELQGY